MDLDQEIENITMEIQHARLAKTEEVYQKVDGLEQNCRNKSGEKVDDYVTCMMNLQENIEFQEEMLAYKAKFALQKAADCIKSKRESGQNLDICKENAKEMVAKFIKQYEKAFI